MSGLQYQSPGVGGTVKLPDGTDLLPASTGAAEGQPQQHMMVQIQAPPGHQGQGFPLQAYIVAPPNFPGTGSGQNFSIALPQQHPTGPQARVSNDPNQPFFTLDLTEDNTDLPLPLEDEVDLSTYPYKINLGLDVVSGKGGKVQQLNRHFRNMVAAAYPTYDSTSSKISKRKIGLKIYQAVIDRGGNFLDNDGNAMDRPKSILKVMKALKDAKTWTSDAKRLAKRKRDEQRARNEKEIKRLREEIPGIEQHMQVPGAASAIPPEAAMADVHQGLPTDVEDMESKQAHGPSSPGSSLLEKRGQALPTQKQKKAQPTPGMTHHTVSDFKTEEGYVAVPETIKLEYAGESVENLVQYKQEFQSVENPVQYRQEFHGVENPVQYRQELQLAEQAAEDVDAAMAEISADVTFEEAAVAAAAAVAAGEAAEEAAAEAQAAGSALGGLQLLTKAAADAGDPSGPHSANVQRFTP